MKLTAAIDEYLADMRSQGRINSPRTERSYYGRLAMHADDIRNRDPRATNRHDVKRTLRRWDHPNTQANARARSATVTGRRWNGSRLAIAPGTTHKAAWRRRPEDA